MGDELHPQYPLELVSIKDIGELMELYSMQIGTDGCTWDEGYPSYELARQDIADKRVFCVREENGKMIATIAWDRDEKVAALSCWDASLHKTAEYARVCVRPDYQHKGLTVSLILGSEERLRKEGYDGAHYIVSKTNHRALQAYQKFEYTCKGEIKLFEHEWYAYEKKL